MDIEYLKQIFKKYHILLDFDIDTYNKNFIFVKFNNDAKLTIMDFEDITSGPINYMYTDNQKYYYFSYLSHYLIVSHKLYKSHESHKSNKTLYRQNVVCLHTNEELDVKNIELLNGYIIQERHLNVNYKGNEIIINPKNININNIFHDKYFVRILQ